MSQILNIDYTTAIAPNIAHFTRTFRLAVSECLNLETSAISPVSFAAMGSIRRNLLAGTTTVRYTVTMAFSNRNALQLALLQISSSGGCLSAVLSQKIGQSITLATPVFLTDTPSPYPTRTSPSPYPSLIPTVEAIATPTASLIASPSSQVGAIVGGSIGGVVALLLLVFLYWYGWPLNLLLLYKNIQIKRNLTQIFSGYGDAPILRNSAYQVISWEDLTIDQTSPLLGKGSFGMVFRGVWKQPGYASGFNIAVKVMSRAMAEAKNLDYADQLNKGREEAEFVHKISLNGPRLSECMTLVYGFAEGPLPPSLTAPFRAPAGDVAFGIVMRLEGGGSLEHHLYTLGTKFSMLEKIRILAGISRGLTALHGIGIVHGDLKPSNVLLSGDNPPKIRLSDFGLSSFKELPATFSSTLNSTVHKKGTIKYCAPEMLDLEDGSGKVASASRRTDMYALAVTTWEILVSMRPFENVSVSNQHQLEREILRGTRPPLTQLPVDTPMRVQQMIIDCWDKDRSKRWTASKCFMAINREYDLLTTKEFDIFFSHRWNDKPFLTHLYNLLCEAGYTVWYDEHHMGHDLIRSMEQGIEKSIVVLACVDSVYQTRPNCMLELKHAHKVVTEKGSKNWTTQKGHRTKCIIGVMMEDGISWQTGPATGNWGTDEVKDILDTKGKMFVSLHALNSPAWEDPDGPTEQMLGELRNHEQTKLLFRLLREQLPTKERVDMHPQSQIVTAFPIFGKTKPSTPGVYGGGDAAAGGGGVVSSVKKPPLKHQDSDNNRAIIAALKGDLDAAQASLAADRARFEREQEERMCIICMENPKSVKLAPCLHMCICPTCSSNPSLRNCPMCRGVITSREQLFV